MSENKSTDLVMKFFPSFDPDVAEEKEKFTAEPKEFIVKDFAEAIRKIIAKEKPHSNI